MLDYQINESISKAYVESVCNHCRRKSKVNEDNNVVSRVSMPIADMRSGAESIRRAKLTPEEIEKEDRFRKRWEKEHAKKQIQRDYERRQTYISAAPEEAPRRPTATLTSGNAYRDSITGSGPSSDPAMRIGKGVYDGIGYMLPAAFVGKFGKGAKIAKELSSQGKRIAALEQAASKGGGGVMKLNVGNKLRKVSSIAKGAAAGYGLDKGTQYIDKKLDDNNLGYIRPTVDGLSELGQWTVGLPYKVGQMVKDTYDETLDEYEKSKGQPCQFMGCTFIGKTEDDLKNHYINDHKCTPKK